jgi:hypothetical protein
MCTSAIRCYGLHHPCPIVIEALPSLVLFLPDNTVSHLTPDDPG